MPMTDVRIESHFRPAAQLPALQAPEFRVLRDLIYEEAGIHFSEVKRGLLQARLARRVRELGLRGFEDYSALVVDNKNAAERVRMLDYVTTNETHFFREPKHFDFVARVAVPHWLTRASAGTMRRRVRVWSAACSTGEEPYSLGMCLLASLPAEPSWDIEVFGSDLSTRALDQSVDATWPIEKGDEIPQQHLQRFMLRGTGAHDGELRCGSELRRIARFARINLNKPPYDVRGQFDVIFCRNVLIYFDDSSRAKVLDCLVDRLSPDGYLFVGHCESLQNKPDRVRQVAPSVYVRRDGASPR